MYINQSGKGYVITRADVSVFKKRQILMYNLLSATLLRTDSGIQRWTRCQQIRWLNLLVWNASLAAAAAKKNVNACQVNGWNMLGHEYHYVSNCINECVLQFDFSCFSFYSLYTNSSPIQIFRSSGFSTHTANSAQQPKSSFSLVFYIQQPLHTNPVGFHPYPDGVYFKCIHTQTYKSADRFYCIFNTPHACTGR